MRIAVAALALALAGCAGIEGDIKRAEMREFFLNFVRGKDRGSGYYAHQIAKSTTKPRGGAYQYVAPAHLSHFYVERSVRGLGGTRIRTSDDLVRVTDWLLYTLAYDPTVSVRSRACENLGRVLLRLPPGDGPPVADDLQADQRINVAAQDLLGYALARNEGQRVETAKVVERMEALAAEAPPTRQAAMQQVRAFAVDPVYGVRTGPVREAADRLVPGLTRDAILVALRETACGDPLRPQFGADSSPLVRASAARVLARSGSPVALEAALWRLRGAVDPAEHDPDVRGRLIEYFAAVGGPRAFDACVQRLDDHDPAVRYHAQRALQRMTGARVRPTSQSWVEWRTRHPEWGAEG